MGDIVGIVILAFLGHRNFVRARQKDQNGLLWAFITIISYIVAQGIGLLLVISWFCADVVDLHMLSNNHGNFQEASAQFNQQVTAAILQNPLRGVTVFLFGIGGYLLVRYILDRKPDKKEPGIHWMDKLGNNS